MTSNRSSNPLTVSYAYTRRQGEFSNGADHYVTHEWITRGRYRRQPGDALCRPRLSFWGLEPTDRTRATCKRCIAIAERHGLAGPLPPEGRGQ